jgi:predicted DNA binding CopG/RHH family protein
MADKRTPSLDGLIQTKGAPRPDTLIQRIEAPSPARMLQDELRAALPVTITAPLEREPRAKSLTLRLSETQYERLRRFAFDHRMSHQDIIERALMDYLSRQGST